jgi:hypothetical protein
LATSQIIRTIDNNRRIMDVAICGKGGRSTQIRRSISMGAKNGIMESTTEKLLSGLLITNIMSRIGMTKNMTTGMISCWASFSEFTIDPMAAYMVA